MHRSSGVSDLRIEMERGREIRGRLQDASDRAAPGYVMIATTLDSGAWGRDSSGVDGSFRIGGLAPKPHSIVGGAELAGFALRAGVTPGGEPLVLTLQPAARIAVRVVDPAGTPVKDACPRVETIDGAPVRLLGRSGRCGPTAASGACELACPAGAVEVSARAAAGAGRGSTSVRSGETASLTVVLQPKAPSRRHRSSPERGRQWPLTARTAHLAGAIRRSSSKKLRNSTTLRSATTRPAENAARWARPVSATRRTRGEDVPVA